MKKSPIKAFCLIAAAFFLLSVLSGCKNDSPATGSSQTAENSVVSADSSGVGSSTPSSSSTETSSFAAVSSEKTSSAAKPSSGPAASSKTPSKNNSKTESKDKEETNMTPAYDIIVMAGQSNSQGSGEGPVSTPYVPNEKVLYMHPDFTIVQACEEVRDGKTIGNFSLSFAQRYLEEGLLKSGRKLLILQTAVGGTGFSDNHWNPGDILYERMVNMISAALSLNENNRIVAFLWHQGETDALNRVSYETHYANLSRFLTSLKGAFDLKDVPLIAGDFVPHFRDANSEICTPVIKAIRELFEAEKNGAFVSSDRLLSNKQAIGIEDTIHFSRDSLYKLGNRYFDAYKQIITK